MELTTVQRLMLLTMVGLVSVTNALPAHFYPISALDHIGPIQDDGWTGTGGLYTGISIPAPGFPFFATQRHTLYVSIERSLSQPTFSIN